MPRSKTKKLADRCICKVEMIYKDIFKKSVRRGGSGNLMNICTVLLSVHGSPWSTPLKDQHETWKNK